MQEKIHFVTGKGGVGKSVVAASLALSYGRRGSSLLAELGDKSFFKDYLNLSEVSYNPVAYQNMSLALWSGDACLREYARHLIKVDALTKLFFENSVMRTFVNIAPALPELAIMGKITSGPRKHGPPLSFKYLTVDAYATGHFVALMRAPSAMAQAVPFGPMGEQSRSIAATLKNPEICEYHIVTLPEELPLREAVELKYQLKTEFGVDAKVYLNKVLPLSGEIQLPENSFGQYLDFQRQRTNSAREYLRKENIAFVEIPWVLEGHGASVIAEISEVLR